MLQEPMMEKLNAMRLLGMVDALKTQEQDPAARELSFLERLGMLVDQQWTWRENQALARRLHVAKLKGASVEDIDYRTSRGLDKTVIRSLAQQSTWAANRENIFVLGGEVFANDGNYPHIGEIAGREREVSSRPAHDIVGPARWSCDVVESDGTNDKYAHGILIDASF